MASTCSAHVVGVHVEAVEVGAHRVEGVLLLQGAGRQVECPVLERVPLADLAERGRLAAEPETGRGGHSRRDTDADGRGLPPAGAG
ncbi:hypothetical protein R2F25_35400 [Streptomyces sp. UP1A-1]|nr:hypothetical protein [Streptomyces sp. UP1A-1]